MHRLWKTLVAWIVPVAILLVLAGLLGVTLMSLTDSHRLAELLLSVVVVSSFAWLTSCR